MAPVRLGFIGYGIMGERLLRAAVRHDPAVIAVAGVWDPSSRAMERLSRHFPDVARAASTHELIEASDFDGSSGSIRIGDWAMPERLDADGNWVAAAGALPADKARPLVLTRQLDKVAAMTRGEAHNLATLREALEVQETVETMLRQEVGSAVGGR